MPKKIEKNIKKPVAVLYVPDDELKAQAAVKEQIPELRENYRLAFRNPALFQPEYLVKNAEVAFIPDREKDKHVVEAYKKAKIKVVLLQVAKKEKSESKE